MFNAANQLAQRSEHQYFGKYRGIVVSNADPQQLGRLKLRVPSVLGESPEAVTNWAWPCVPYGGIAEQGWFVIPDVGAKVWVEFEEGNLDAPIWVGTFWSRPGDTTEIPTEAQAMEEDENGNATIPSRRVLKTVAGHVLEFCDIEDEASIRITHKDGASVVFDKDGSVVLRNKEGSMIYLNAKDQQVALVEQNGNNIRMSDGGTTITNNDGTVIDLSADAVQVIAKNVHVRSETVSLGEGAMEPAILGTTFASIFDAHTHPTAMGPSGPPIPVPMPLSAPTNPAISKVVKLK